MAINPTKLLPPSSGALALRSKTTDVGKKKSGGLEGQVLVIKTQVIKIEKLISRGYTLKLKEQKEEQKELEKNKRSKKEEELEEKKPPKEGKGKIPSLPKLGFFDRIKNFIGKTLLAYFAVRLIDHLPKLVPFVTALGNASEFLLDVGGNFLNGLVTFIDWGYKAYDATRGFLKNLGGDNFTKVFDTFNGAVGNLIETAIIAAVTLSSFGGGADVPEPKRGFDTSGRRVSTETQKRYAQRFGKNQFAKRFGKSNLINLGERGASKSVLKFVKPFTKRLPIIGALLDFGLSVALGEDPGRAAFKAIGAGLLGAVGAAVGSLVFGFGGVIGGILGSIGGDAIGGALYDVLFGGKKPQQKNQKVQKKQGGGITRGGKAQGSISRKISSKEKQRRKTRVSQKPREIEFDTPGSSVGGEEKLFGIFPNPFKKVADTFNPFKNVADAGKNLGKTDYFGPILAITSKITLGQKPTEQDYKQVGLGINLLFSEGMSKGEIVGGVAAAYADGGFVDKKSLDALMEGGDITNWVARTFKDATETNAQKTLREIRENAGKKKEGEDGRPSGTPSGAPGEMGDATLSDSEMDLFQRLVYAESGGEGKVGMALVARSVLNRAGLIQSGKATTGTFSAKDKTVTGVIMGSGQYSPVGNGRINDKRTQKQMDDAKEAIRLAQDPEKLKALLKSEGIDDGSIKKLLASTGFRNYNAGAGYDASQAVNEVRYKRHTFNTAGNTGLVIASSQISEKIKPVPLSGGDGRFIQGNSGRSYGTHFHIGTNKPGDGSGVANAGFNVIKHFLGKKSVYVGRSGETIPTNATDEQIRGYIGRGQAAHRQTELDLQIGGIGAGNKVAFPLALKNMKYSATDGYGVSADIVGTNAFVGHGRYKPDGTLAPQQRLVLNTGAPDYYAFHGMNKLMTKEGLLKFHKGERIRVVDKDSVDLLSNELVDDIISIENKSQLIGKAPSIIERLKAISGYASYEDGAQEEVIVIQNQPLQEESYQNPMVVAMSGLSGGDSYNPFEMLDRLPG